MKAAFQFLIIVAVFFALELAKLGMKRDVSRPLRTRRPIK